MHLWDGGRPGALWHARTVSARILMMVGNDIRLDTRVYKSALALADGGLEVTLLGWSPTGYREETWFGPVRIIREPVQWQLRDDAAVRRQARREARLVPAPPDADDRRARRLRYDLRRSEAVELGGGAARQARTQLIRARGIVRNQWGRVLSAASGREDRWRESFHQWIDEQTAFAGWRHVLPEIDDYDLAFAPVIDSLDWQILHAHDVHHVGTAARAVARRRAQGRPAKWVYDAHEYVAGLSVYPPRTKRVVAAFTDLEAEYIRLADAVVTVTPPLAERLREQYTLPSTPTVVMNSPQLSADPALHGPDVRQACGLDAGVPLIVYSGGVTSARGVPTLIEALVELPEVHLALVCVPHSRTRRIVQMRERARELGVVDRLHLLDPVPPSQVAAFLATADVGTAPFLHFGSHEFALPNKLFEYLHAGLPLVVSDCRAQAEFVREKGVGAVFEAEDVSACADAVRAVLGRRDELHRRIVEDDTLLEPYSWERQAAALRGLYRDLLDAPAAVSEPGVETNLQEVHEEPAWREGAPVVGIGPANFAGQGWAWAKALEREVPGAVTRVVKVDRGEIVSFAADETVDLETYRRDSSWGRRLEDEAMRGWTHALLEAGRPLFGIRNGKDFEGDLKRLLARDIRTGLVMHGSEIRDPRRHATTTPWSPFTDPRDELTAGLQSQRDVLAAKVLRYASQGVPVLMSTPDLLGEVPGSVWLPVVVDLQRWQPGAPVLTGERPVVVHVPSRAAMKGSSRVDEVLGRLHERGDVVYRRLQGVPPDRMPQVLAEADILLDQFALGSYGVLACEGMAAGRIVIGHVTDEVRSVVRTAAGTDLPVLEANPETVEEVLARVVADRAGALARAQDGRRFVENLHDGRRSAAVLREHLHLGGA